MSALPWFARVIWRGWIKNPVGVWHWCYGLLKEPLLCLAARRLVCARGGRPAETWNEQSRQWRIEEYALLLVLRQEPARGAQAHRRSDRLYLRRVCRTVYGHHSRGEQILAGEV